VTDTPARNRVLVIDDQGMVREVFQRSLRAAGFDVVVATGGAEGLQIMRHDPSIGLVLLDLDMPGIDGREVRRRQLADPALAAIPTIIVTGSVDGSVAPEDLQAADLLRKPVPRDRLIEAVSRYCRPTLP
jgi:CheY-like chemotaxis protein